MAGRVRRALLSGALLSTVLPVLAVAPAAAAPTFALPFQCGQTGWLASTFAGHVPNGYAIDFNMAGDGDNGKPVLASAAGVVSHPAYSSASNPLAIDHDGGGWRSGWASLYLHMNVTVANGASVKRGDLLGYVSNVGAPGGRHLHYEQRLDGTVQPARFSHWVPDYGPAMYQGLGIAVPASDNCDAPPPPPPPRDGDGDGVADDSDVCPRVPGPANTRGCPPEDFDASSRSDFDGDGRSDVAAFYDYGGALTRGFVFGGSPTGLSSGGTRFWDSGAGNFEAGRARFVAGDFNGDGRSDVAAFYDYGGALTRGFVFSGTPTGLSSGMVRFWDSGAGNFEAGRSRFVGGGEITRPPAGSPPAVPPAGGTPPAAPASPPAASDPSLAVISLVSSTRRSRLAKGIPLTLTGAKSRSRYTVTMLLGRRKLASFRGRATTRGVVSVKLKLSPRSRARVKGRKAVQVKVAYVRPDGERLTVTRTLRLR